jgi:hypothetical protein
LQIADDLVIECGAASIGSVGDAYATMGWVDWDKNQRLHSTLDNISPAEFELNYYATIFASQPSMSHT